ncbi:hypothetical protein D3C78_1083640 [compost metagenome]
MRACWVRPACRWQSPRPCTRRLPAPPCCCGWSLATVYPDRQAAPAPRFPHARQSESGGADRTGLQTHGNSGTARGGWGNPPRHRPWEILRTPWCACWKSGARTRRRWSGDFLYSRDRRHRHRLPAPGRQCPFFADSVLRPSPTAPRLSRQSCPRWPSSRSRARSRAWARPGQRRQSAPERYGCHCAW